MRQKNFAILMLLAAAQSLGQETGAESAASTVVYKAEFFAQYNPVTANDMLERIPGLDLSAIGSAATGERGLGTGGNLLIKRLPGNLR